jgi:hypothetical protein
MNGVNHGMLRMLKRRLLDTVYALDSVRQFPLCKYKRLRALHMAERLANAITSIDEANHVEPHEPGGNGSLSVHKPGSVDFSPDDLSAQEVGGVQPWK